MMRPGSALQRADWPFRRPRGLQGTYCPLLALCRSLQPKFCGGLVEAIVLILTFAGALFATVLTAGYYVRIAGHNSDLVPSCKAAHNVGAAPANTPLHRQQ